jgi:hypothetical protein
MVSRFILVQVLNGDEDLEWSHSDHAPPVATFGP